MASLEQGSLCLGIQMPNDHYTREIEKEKAQTGPKADTVSLTEPLWAFVLIRKEQDTPVMVSLDHELEGLWDQLRNISFLGSVGVVFFFFFLQRIS